MNAPARVLTTAALRQQVLRLLPTVRIGSAWTTRALVNAETILWAETSAAPQPRHRDGRRPTGRIAHRLRPRRLELRRLGNRHHDRPGQAVHRKSDPCETAQCPDYYGHTYADTGHVTITLTVAWHAEFSLDNGATWTAVDPAALTGPATTHDLAVVQARGIIVQNP